MMRTTNILGPTIALGLLAILAIGLAVVYNGGSLDVQMGVHNRIRVEGVQSSNP
jgi:hypothetical protein